MMKILINSYTCCPGMGSEQGMGWNWITSLAKTGEVELFVISEGEYRSQIEDYLLNGKWKMENGKCRADEESATNEKLKIENGKCRADEESATNGKLAANGKWKIENGKYRADEESIANEKLKIENGKCRADEGIEADEKLKNRNEGHWTDRLHFYWNPIGGEDEERCAEIRRMCWNQGDWRFYKYYREWQLRTAEIAREICSKEKIDILHQLNMIGFREPGYLAEVSKETGIPLVWGPIGGLKMFPMAYRPPLTSSVWGGLKMIAFLWLKNTITEWQIKNDRRVVETLKQASLLISSIPDSYEAIKKYHGLESVIIPETGCFTNDTLRYDDDNCSKNIPQPSTHYSHPLTLLWVGKFDFRKRLDIALMAIATVANPNILLKVFGTGSEKQVAEAKRMTELLGIEDMVQFMGVCPNDEVKAEMSKADAFLFTSVNEDTSTVVLEAVSNLLPVICFDCCGMAAVIDERVGIKVPLSNPEQSVKDFAAVIERIYKDRDLLARMSENCIARAQELSWENKAKEMVRLYKLKIEN